MMGVPQKYKAETSRPPLYALNINKLFSLLFAQHKRRIRFLTEGKGRHKELKSGCQNLLYYVLYYVLCVVLYEKV